MTRLRYISPLLTCTNRAGPPLHPIGFPRASKSCSVATFHNCAPTIPAGPSPNAAERARLLGATLRGVPVSAQRTLAKQTGLGGPQRGKPSTGGCQRCANGPSQDQLPDESSSVGR